jgi:hypothetical protein
VNTGLTIANVNRLTTAGSTLFAGATFGLYRTTNSGANWTAINTGLPENLGLIFPTILSLTSVPAGTGGANLLAGTFFLGVWRRPVSEVTDVRPISSSIPDGFSLSQNYPNPFNPSTNIKYQTPNTNHVTLKVFDILGCEVATLVNEVRQPGTYTVQWDASGHASGMYFYQLRTGSFVDVKKCLVLK